MFQRIIVFFLIFCTLFACLTREFIMAEFEINKDYIAANLCINRDKPQLHCNGKCYLMEKLKQAEDNEKKQNAKTKLDNFSCFSNVQKFAISPQSFIFHPAKPLSHYVCLYTSKSCDAIFRPPRV